MECANYFALLNGSVFNGEPQAEENFRNACGLPLND
jgi:hypothetical protein